MRIKHRFGFNSGNANITHFLETNKINHKNSGIVTAFEMYEDNEKFSSVRAFMTLHNISSISESVYTVDEIDNAKWLTVRSSWRSLYPYPRENMNYIFTTYDTTNYCEGDVPDYYCRKGAKQNECFMLEKEPNWGSRNFLMLNCVEDELFISQKAEETLRDSELTGFDLYDVFNKSKKRLESIKQVYVNKYLVHGFSDDAIQEALVCPKCGFKKYLPKVGVVRFRKEVFEDIGEDIVKTNDKFGGIFCFSLILITHKFYKVITNAKLERGLVFEPVELV